MTDAELVDSCSILKRVRKAAHAFPNRAKFYNAKDDQAIMSGNESEGNCSNYINNFNRVAQATE